MSGHPGSLSTHQHTALHKQKERMGQLEGQYGEYAKRFFLFDDAMTLRFLRARKFDVDKSFDMILETIRFRLGFQQIGVDALSTPLCSNELKTGKSFFHNYDHEGRPICYIRARLHDPSLTDPLENQRYTVLMMEYGRRLLKPPCETVTLVFDMTSVALKNLDLKSVQFMINTLQNYYPESLGRVLVYNYTWIVNGAWKVIKPWLDPVTAAKVFFIKQDELTKFIPLENLPTEYGGKDPFVYQASAYRERFDAAMTANE